MLTNVYGIFNITTIHPDKTKSYEKRKIRIARLKGKLSNSRKRKYEYHTLNTLGLVPVGYGPEGMEFEEQFVQARKFTGYNATTKASISEKLIRFEYETA